MTMAESKPKRLRPWLEGHLNRGDIPGLRWLNEDRTLFRITWKHHGKQDWSLEHGRVFMVSVRKQLIDIFVSFLRIFVPPASEYFLPDGRSCVLRKFAVSHSQARRQEMKWGGCFFVKSGLFPCLQS